MDRADFAVMPSAFISATMRSTVARGNSGTFLAKIDGQVGFPIALVGREAAPGTSRDGVTDATRRARFDRRVDSSST